LERIERPTVTVSTQTLARIAVALRTRPDLLWLRAELYADYDHGSAA
jgi:hypothetical protein